MLTLELLPGFSLLGGRDVHLPVPPFPLLCFELLRGDHDPFCEGWGVCQQWVRNGQTLHGSLPYPAVRSRLFVAWRPGVLPAVFMFLHPTAHVVLHIAVPRPFVRR